MKVDTKIVPIEVKEGWFKKKQMHQLRYKIELTEVEKATIERSGLREFVYFEKEHRLPDGSEPGIQEFPIWWVIAHPFASGVNAR